MYTVPTLIILYCRVTNFRKYKIWEFRRLFRTLKILIFEIVRSYSSTAYYLLMLENSFTRYQSAEGKILTIFIALQQLIGSQYNIIVVTKLVKTL